VKSKENEAQPGMKVCKQPRDNSDSEKFSPAEKTTARIYELNRHLEDARASIDIVKTVQDALAEIELILQRMRKLSVQAAGEKLSPFEQNLAQKEIENCIAEIDRIAADTENRAAGISGAISPGPGKPLH